MKFPSKGGTDFEIPPPGNHAAICNLICDVGLQPGSGMYPEEKPQVYIRFELVDEIRKYKDKGGHEVEAPMTIGRMFTASMHEKANLRKFVESWSGKPFKDDDEASEYEFKKLPGKSCLLNVVHVTRGTKTYANIKDVTPLPKSMKITAQQYNPTIYFSLDDPKTEDFNRLPKWLKEKIENRLEEKDATEGTTLPPIGAGMATGPINDNDDDIPF